MTKTITNKAFAFVVAIVTVFSLSLMTLSTVNAGDNDALAALLLGLGLTQEQVDTVIASMGGSSTGDEGSSSASCGTTETYVHHPGIDYEFTKFMKKGSRGTEVEMLQKVLNVANGTSISEDGVFGNGTKNAVMTFQAANGLGADGVVGAMSRAELNKKTSTTVECEEGEGEEGNATEDKLTVSGVASDDMIVGAEQTIVFAKLKLAAGTKDVDVKKIYVKYTGTADTDVIDKVVLLDSAMLEIDTDSLDSDDEATLKADLTVKDGESTTVYLAAVTSAAPFSSEGLDASLKVTSITTDGADVEGTPIMGASHEFNDGVSVDDFNVDIDNESGDVKIGEEDVKITTITIKAGDDAQTVKSMKLERTASASKAGDDDLDNVYIKVKGEKYKASQDDEDYTFDFGDGIFLEEDGDDEDFVVYADIEDGSGSKFRFDITDVVVTDENGILLSKDGVSTLADAGDEFTIELSEVTISKTTDTQSEKVSAGQDAVELASFEVEVTGKDLEGDVKVTIELNGAGAAANTKDIDLDNVAIYTADGTRVSDREDTSFTAVLDTTEYEITFDDVTFEAGDDAVDYVIKGDVNEDAVDGTKYTITEIVYTSIEDTDGEDISAVTETIASPAEIEVEGAVIEVSIEEADDTDINTNTDDVEVAQIKFDANDSGDDIKVTKVKVDIVVNDVDGTGNLTNDDLRNCELFDGSTSLSDKEDGGTSITFNVDFNITKDTEKNISVRCDIGSDFTNTDTITVTGVDFDAKGVNTDTDLDAAITDSAVATVTTGAITLTFSSDDENDDKVVRDNDDNVVLGVYEFKAKDAVLNIDDVTYNFNADVSDIIDGKIEIFIDGSSEGKEDLNVAGTSVVFENISKEVAKDQTVVIKFVADMDAVGTITPATGDSVEITTEEGPTATVDGDNPVVTVVTAVPVLTLTSEEQRDNVDDADDMVLFSYKVKAEGGDVLLKSTLLTTSLTDATLSNPEVRVYDNSSMSGTEEFKDAFTSGVAVTPGVLISENDTYYVFLVADVVSNGGTVRTEMLDDATGVVFVTDTDGNGTVVDGTDADLTGDKVMEDDMKSRIDFKSRD